MQQTTPHIPYDLQQAINKIYLWVKDGCPRNEYFCTNDGICSNTSYISSYTCTQVTDILFGDDEFPFNNEIGDYHYFKEIDKYKNPKRLAWLQKHQTVE